MVQDITVDHCAGVALPGFEFVILSGQEAPKVLASTNDLVLDAVVQETLEARTPFADGLRVVSIVTLKVNLGWNRWDDAREMLYLQGLDQPLQIAITSVDLDEWELGVVL